MSVEARMVHRLSVERATAGAADDYGQPAQAWAASASAVPANIVAKSAHEVALLSQGGAVVSAMTIHLPIGTDITPADRLHHDPAACPVSANDVGDVLYQLTAVRDASGAGIFLRCDATEVA
jgi:head-tail adaptor